MADYVRVVGRFFTHQKTDNTPVPLVGRVFFTPVTSAYGEGTVYGAVERTGYVIDGVLCEDKAGATPGLSLLAPGEGVQPSAWSYRVVFSLTDEDGDRACLKSFYLEAKAGEEIDLATASPVPDPVTGEYMLRGDRGEKGDPGRDGVSYTGIDLVGEELVFHRSDGEDQRVPAPRGKDGEPGRDGVDGAPGKDGVSPPAPNLTVGEVSEGEAAATVTGSYPDLKINLTIPRGATGAKGDTGSAGPKGDTGNIGPRGERGETGAKGADAEPLNLAVTASTLAAGSEATAQLSGDYPNLTLALGLPVGAKGEQGVGLPGPKGERGDVTVTQQGMVFGEGFPEGKVTANPGTVYTDAAMTNGAMQWIKKTGTGATGWTVTVGDTGWRDISSTAVDPNASQPGGRILIRRRAENVDFKLVKLAPLSAGGFPVVEGKWIPDGYIPENTVVFHLTNIGRNESANGVAGRLSPSAWWKYQHPMKIQSNMAIDCTGVFSCVTSQPWPSVLPGTPA